VIESALSMTVKSIIAKLQRQQRDLKVIVAALRYLDALGPHKAHHKISFDDFEKRLVAQALRRAGGNQTEAGRILQLSRDRVRAKIAQAWVKSRVRSGVRWSLLGHVPRLTSARVRPKMAPALASVV
jgi:DNA-binding NtrC family response regulator